jgi:serine protease Do
MMAGPGAMLIPGVVVQPVTEDLARKFGIEKPGGVVVTSVSDESPFGDFILPGMQILEINDEEVDDPRQAKSLIKPGAVNRLWVVFKGKTGYIGIRVPAN